MSMIDRPCFVRLATAMASVGATALLRLALGPGLGGQAAFLLFALALLAAAMIAGSRAATMATIPALGFGLLFSGQRNVESFEPAVAGTFLLTAMGIVLLANRLQKPTSRLDEREGHAYDRTSVGKGKGR